MVAPFCWRHLEDHPGGDDVLLSSTGKDATDDFEDAGHSNTARAMMEEYLVGEVDASTIPSRTKYVPPKQPHYNEDKTPRVCHQDPPVFSSPGNPGLGCCR